MPSRITKLFALIAVIGGLVALGPAIRAETPVMPPSTEELGPHRLRSKEITSIVDALGGWHSQGLDHLFGRDVTGSLIDPTYKGDSILSDAVLQSDIIRYAEAQHGQAVAVPFPANWAIRPSAYNAPQEFARARAENRLTDWLQTLPPPFQGYRDLVSALEHYRQIEGQGGWTSLTEATPLKFGMISPHVAALRDRLAREGYEIDLTGPLDRFDAGLQDAVFRFQHSHGLAPTGVVDKATLASLNIPIETRIAQIVANLERWRWLPRVLPNKRIEVNIAAATADLFEADQPILSMRVIIGRAADPTPMLQAEIERLILNPSWWVPSKIAAREILPKARRDPDYLTREGFVLQVDPVDKGRVRVRQLPGEQNALGRIKFDMPNAFDVYLHDTPTRTLFDRSKRALSHGCIRVERPFELAIALLKDDPAWTSEALAEAMARRNTQRIPLAKPVRVFLLYWTAFVDRNGIVNFREDLYGWDERLFRLVG